MRCESSVVSTGCALFVTYFLGHNQQWFVSVYSLTERMKEWKNVQISHSKVKKRTSKHIMKYRQRICVTFVKFGDICFIGHIGACEIWYHIHTFTHSHIHSQIANKIKNKKQTKKNSVKWHIPCDRCRQPMEKSTISVVFVNTTKSVKQVWVSFVS